MSLSTRPADNSPEWQSLINVLAGSPTFAESVVEDNEEIVINQSLNHTADLLRAKLSSPEMLLSQLWYTLQSNNHSTNELIATNYAVPLSIDTIDAQMVFNKLLDVETRRRLGTFAWQVDNEKHLLIDTLSKENADLLPVCEAQISFLRNALAHASFSQLRWAISNKSVTENTYPKKSEEKGPLEPIIDRILGIKKDNTDGSILFYFDYGLLYQCITTPELTSQGNQIRINKKHLINYLVSTTDGVLLEQVGENQAKAILFNHTQVKAVRPQQHHILLIDCSSSMEYKFSKHIIKIIEFVNKLREQSESATIEFVAFNNTYFNMGTYKITQKNKIDKLLSDLQTEGLTCLFGTINHTLSKLNQRRNQNICIYIFTDGCNTISLEKNDEKKLLDNACATMSKESNPPKIYVIGIGHDYDKKLAMELSNITKGALIEASDATQFSEIFSYLKKIDLPRDIQKIVTEFMGKLREERVAVYSGQPAISDARISVPGNFTVTRNGQSKTFHVESGAPKLVQTTQNANNPMVLFADRPKGADKSSSHQRSHSR